jgi:predicted peptidase
MNTRPRSIAAVLVLFTLATGVTFAARWTESAPGRAPEHQPKAKDQSVHHAATNPGFSLRTYTSNGTSLRWSLYIPADVKGPLPLVVFLHGSGECGTDGLKQMAVGLGPALLGEKDRWPCAIIFAQKPTQRAAWSDHADAVFAMIDEAKASADIDADRISLTGLSQGGCGTWEIAAKKPELFCAIAPICGYGDAEKIASGIGKVPVWAFHGEKDNVVPPAKTKAIVDAVKAKGGDVTLTLFPDANHNSWDKAYRSEKLAEWLMSKRRAK